MESWHRVENELPPVGNPVAVSGGGAPIIAYYCDGGYYFLNYDNILGVMRKEYLDIPVKYWTEIIIPKRE